MENILVIILLLAVHAAVSTGSAQPKREDPCQSAAFASEINLYCENRVSPSFNCCQSVIASVDIMGTGTAPCLCRVAAEPQLIMAGLNTDSLLAMFASCRALALGGAPLEVECEDFTGVANSPPPPTTELYQATTSQNSTAIEPLQGGTVAAALRNAHRLAFQLNSFCYSGVVNGRCCKAVVSSIDIDNSSETPFFCLVVDQWVFLSSGLGINDIVGQYDACTGRQGVHQLFDEIC